MALFTALRTNMSVIICHEGTKAFSSKKSMDVLQMPSESSLLKKNPKKMIMIVPTDNEDDCTIATSSSASTVTTFEEEQPASCGQQDSDSDSANKNKNSNKRRRRRTSLVQFTPGTATDPELTTRQKNKRKIKKRKSYSPSSESSSSESESAATADFDTDCDICDDSVLWWTKEELKAIQCSCVYAVRSYEYGLPLAMDEECLTSLDRFSSQNRKRRKLVRSQMYETAKAVKDFEAATGLSTKTPEILSELLQTYSKPMGLEAIESALQLRASTTTRMRTVANAN